MSNRATEELEMFSAHRRAHRSVVVGRGRWLMASLALFLAILAYVAGQSGPVGPNAESDQTAAFGGQLPK